MTTTMKSTHRTLASLNLPTKMSALVLYAQGIVKAMTGNVAFANPIPPITAIVTAITEFQTAETAALARTKGAAATRNEKRGALWQGLEQGKTSGQAAADASPENASSIILGAGIAVRKAAVRPPRVFE